jgi:hypothetical protein
MERPFPGGLPIDPGSFSRKYVIVEPLVKWKIIGKAPEQGHGQVGMAVDKPGHHQYTGLFDYPGMGNVSEVPGLADPGNDIVMNDNGPIPDHGAIGIHGQNQAGYDGMIILTRYDFHCPFPSSMVPGASVVQTVA